MSTLPPASPCLPPPVPRAGFPPTRPLLPVLMGWLRDHASAEARADLAKRLGDAGQTLTPAGVLSILPGVIRHAAAADPEVRREVLRAIAEEASGPRHP
jgi:hypothetical protein